MQPGDVLASILRKFSEPCHQDVPFRYLRSGIRQSRDVKTRDIGQASGKTLALDDVFVDLPIDERRNEVAADLQGEDDGEANRQIEFIEVEEFDPGSLVRTRVLASLMLRSADKFELREKRGRGKRTPLSNRIFLLGGPGQGKSTVGQYLTKICRARLLCFTKELQTPEVNLIIDAILTRASALKIPISGSPRFPFNVELPRLADALSEAQRKGEALTLLSYLARQISSIAEEVVSAALLRQWLTRVPSIFILDGLDEVSHSANRQELLSAIEQLLDFHL